MTTARSSPTAQRYQDVSVTEIDVCDHVIAQQDVQGEEEKSIDVLHKRANDLMIELSRTESELRNVIITIRRDANTMMDRATYNARRKRGERRSTYFFLFLGIVFLVSAIAIIATTTTCKK